MTSVMTMALRYTGLSTRTTFRNKRFLIFTLGLPVILYLIYANLYAGQTITEGSTYDVNAYLMVSMAGFGGIGAAVNSGARIAVERQTGWNRQLRLTALTPQAYLASKAAVSMLVCLPAIILVFVAGRFVGDVHLSAGQWIGSALAIWLGLIPFAIIGLVIGFAGTPDSVQPITMLVYLGSSMLGGLWFPLEQMAGWIQSVAKATPGYHLAAIARAVDGYGSVGVLNIAVLAAWSVAMAVVGTWAYRRSGAKV